MVDLRLYRAAFLPALAAVGALLFSLQSMPEPLQPLVSPGTFDGTAATRFARQIAGIAPSRPPGSEGDLKAAATVERTFRSIRDADVIEQSFSSDGKPMKNVILRLPGRSDRTIALIASRDSVGGPGAATSAAATGALMELAVELGGITHDATILVASTDGSTAGEVGAEQFGSEFLDTGNVEGVVALDAPGLEQPREPYLLDTADGPRRGGIQLERTAERALRDQAAVHVDRPGPLQQLARLALPLGIGEQAPLIAMGIDAISITAGGELPVLPPEAEALSPGSLIRFARAALDVELSLDSAGSVQHGPDSYIEVGGTIVPGWAIRLLALALILPALVAAVDATARAARQGQGVPALRWAAPRGLPILAAVVLVYALAWIGIIARPDFPFDPRSIGIGLSEVLKILVVVGVAVAVWRAFGGNAIPDGLSREAIAGAAGLLATAAVLAVWIFNPYLGLLIVPLAHAWVPSAREARRPLRTAAVIVLASLPFLLAAASVAARLHLGSSVPWQAVVVVGDWGISPLVAIPGALLAGWVASLVVATRT